MGLHCSRTTKRLWLLGKENVEGSTMTSNKKGKCSRRKVIATLCMLFLVRGHITFSPSPDLRVLSCLQPPQRQRIIRRIMAKTDTTSKSG
ncbi:hypothetical protein Tco_1446996 [Tanacetum coccineum]